MKALILIDIQKGFDHPNWGARNNLNFEGNIENILRMWRLNKHPLIHIQHISIEKDSPLRPGQDGVSFKICATPLKKEPVFQKSVHSAFIGTDLDKYLENNNIKDIVLVGLTSDHCVSTTARMGYDLGYNVTIFEDAVATFNRKAVDGRNIVADTVQEVSLASLNKEFAKVMNSRAYFTAMRL